MWKNDEAAHPYHVGNIILAHNGRIEDHHDLLKSADIPNPYTYGTDSHALAAILAKENKSDIFSRCYGSIATIFHCTAQEGKLWVFRNNLRELYRGKCDEGMYISSEKEALKIIGCDNIEEFKERWLYCISNGQIENQVKLKEPPTKVINYGNPRGNHHTCMTGDMLETDEEYATRMEEYYNHGNYSALANPVDNKPKQRDSNYYWNKLEEDKRKRANEERLNNEFKFTRKRYITSINLFMVNTIGRWIQVSAVLNGDNYANIAKGEWYFIDKLVEDDVDSSSFLKRGWILEDENGKPGSITKSSICALDYSVKKGDFLIAKSWDNDNSIRYESGSIFAVENDLLQATEDEVHEGIYKKSVSCINTVSGNECVIFNKYYRIALEHEVRLKSSKDLIRYNLDGKKSLTSYNVMSEIEDIEVEEQNIIDNQLPIEELEMAKYYDEVKEQLQKIRDDFDAVIDLINVGGGLVDIKMELGDLDRTIIKAEEILVQKDNVKPKPVINLDPNIT